MGEVAPSAGYGRGVVVVAVAVAAAAAARRRLLGLLGSDFRSTDGDGARARVLSPPQLCLHVKCLWDAVAVEVAVAVVSEVEDRCGSAPGLTEGLGHLPKSR
jgi:hypothetical protein